MKLVHRLYEPTSWPWKRWFFSRNDQTLDSHDDNSFIANLIHVELERYRSITHIRVGNGESTSFWHDHWLLNTSLAQLLSALYSHSTCQHLSVAETQRLTLCAQLRPRLSRSAAEEKILLEDCLSHVSLTAQPDCRILNHSSGTEFRTSDVYKALQTTLQPDPDAARLWKTKLPKKIQFFGWLLHRGRVNCRAYLYHCNIKSLEEASCEDCHGVLETTEHIFSTCPRAAATWLKIQISCRPERLLHPWLLGSELPLPYSVCFDVAMLILWQLWKARNARVFDHKSSSAEDVIRRVVNDLDTWHCRYGKLKDHLKAWRDHLHSCL
ncbi:hypothetical protein HU200_000282 [Digitaria exilis]|uniref:Reverse transcriptase zinc-binding domain-containing protein n=1 Tax=Digitaria exilis TaxID=1010633 RepID=A0A835KWZ2_9POAL|nr:hypothetical protein HU200_000282 [Digitaria exilis]